ncbi:CatB-related O-acetyltransferase [Pedobacter lithocola]|uniref:CatB-related O-acetyltransferase n=1 Tax=Pedobacter lithocola TaxID=1908239 RepID=A0ABV8P3R5_9SPHI
MVVFFLKRLVQNLLSNVQDILNLYKFKKKHPSCEFLSGAKISNSLFGNHSIIFNDVIIDSCSIGDHTYIQKKSTIFNADIGKFCSIASQVSIGPGIHKVDGVSTHPAFYLRNTPLKKKFSDKDLFLPFKKTTIGHDVWIGERAILIDGISIGTGAIIAAGSVVTKDVEPYSVVGGVPAKHIKFRVGEDERELLLASKWWDFSDEWLSNNYILFGNVSEFLKKI